MSKKMDEYNQISVSKFKATCLELLQKVFDTDQELLITKNNKPIALVTPPPVFSNKSNAFGSMKGQIEILSDINQPLGTEDWGVYKK